MIIFFFNFIIGSVILLGPNGKLNLIFLGSFKSLTCWGPLSCSFGNQMRSLHRSLIFCSMSNDYYHSFSEPNVYLAQLRMERSFAGLQVYYNQKSVFRGFVDLFSLELKVLRMKTKCVSKFFISSVFTSESQCPKIPYFGLLTYINKQLKPRFLTMHRIKLE